MNNPLSMNVLRWLTALALVVTMVLYIFDIYDRAKYRRTMDATSGLMAALCAPRRPWWKFWGKP